MRDWNYVCVNKRKIHQAFVAYLWGIETRRKWKENICWSVFVAYLWGIETRFHLKPPFFKSKFVAYLWGIETGLYTLQLLTAETVCSVPMRDWNPNNKDAYYFPFAFVAYLWGIETLIWINFEAYQFRFVAYLWGIETTWVIKLFLTL